MITVTPGATQSGEESAEQIPGHLLELPKQVLNVVARHPDRFAPCDLHKTLDQNLDDILRLFQADSGSVMLCEARKHRVAVDRGLPKAANSQVHHRRDGTVSSRVIAGRKPVIQQGLIDDAIPRPHSICSISIPLVNGQNVLGLLNINSSDPQRLFGEEELALATLIGHHLALTIENVRLRDEAKKQSRYFSYLYKIARTITSTLELDLVLKMIAEYVHRVIACDVCALLLHNPDTGALELARGQGIPNGTRHDYIGLVEPSAREAHARRKLIAVREAGLPKDLGLRSGVVVPLIIKRKVVGYIAGFRSDCQSYPQRTTRLLLGLAELAAIAIENARLYRRQSGIAHITQRELTPERFELIRGYEVGSRYTPAHQVGGDYCDVIRINRQKFGLVVADVAGRDVIAALHIAKCKHAVRVLADCIRSPAKLMLKLNKFIYEHTEPESFISMFYAVLDTRKSMLTYSVAGHEPGLLLRAQEGRVEQVRTSGILLGIDPAATFEERTTYLNMGDTLFLYTDGLIEALCSGQTDGLDILEEVFLQRRLEPAQRLADNIHRVAIGNQAGRSPDDIAIMTLRKT